MVLGWSSLPFLAYSIKSPLLAVPPGLTWRDNMRRASFTARGADISLLGEYIRPGAGVRGKLEIIWLVEEVGGLSIRKVHTIYSTVGEASNHGQMGVFTIDDDMPYET